MTLIPESPGFCGLGDTASRGSGSFNFTFRSSGSCGNSSECSVGGEEIVASWAWSTPFTGCILLLLPDRNFSSSPAADRVGPLPPPSFLQRSFGSLRPLCCRSRFRARARLPRRSAPGLLVLCGSVELASPASGGCRYAHRALRACGSVQPVPLGRLRSGTAVVGRISRLRMRPVPAPDLKVEWTRNDRLKNLFADDLHYQQVKVQRRLL